MLHNYYAVSGVHYRRGTSGPALPTIATRALQSQLFAAVPLSPTMFGTYHGVAVALRNWYYGEIPGVEAVIR